MNKSLIDHVLAAAKKNDEANRMFQSQPNSFQNRGNWNVDAASQLNLQQLQQVEIHSLNDLIRNANFSFQPGSSASVVAVQNGPGSANQSPNVVIGGSNVKQETHMTFAPRQRLQNLEQVEIHSLMDLLKNAKFNFQPGSQVSVVDIQNGPGNHDQSPSVNIGGSNISQETHMTFVPQAALQNLEQVEIHSLMDLLKNAKFNFQPGSSASVVDIQNGPGNHDQSPSVKIGGSNISQDTHFTFAPQAALQNLEQVEIHSLMDLIKNAKFNFQPGSSASVVDIQNGPGNHDQSPSVNIGGSNISQETHFTFAPQAALQNLEQVEIHSLMDLLKNAKFNFQPGSSASVVDIQNGPGNHDQSPSVKIGGSNIQQETHFTIPVSSNTFLI